MDQRQGLRSRRKAQRSSIACTLFSPSGLLEWPLLACYRYGFQPSVTASIRQELGSHACNGCKADSMLPWLAAARHSLLEWCRLRHILCCMYVVVVYVSLSVRRRRYCRSPQTEFLLPQEPKYRYAGSAEGYMCNYCGREQQRPRGKAAYR